MEKPNARPERQGEGDGCLARMLLGARAKWHFFAGLSVRPRAKTAENLPLGASPATSPSFKRRNSGRPPRPLSSDSYPQQPERAGTRSRPALPKISNLKSQIPDSTPLPYCPAPSFFSRVGAWVWAAFSWVGRIPTVSTRPLPRYCLASASRSSFLMLEKSSMSDRDHSRR